MSVSGDVFNPIFQGRRRRVGEGMRLSGREGKGSKGEMGGGRLEKDGAV